jgi:hypothetical protein
MYYCKLYFKSNLWIHFFCDVESGIPKFEILAPPLLAESLLEFRFRVPNTSIQVCWAMKKGDETDGLLQYFQSPMTHIIKEDMA